MELGDTSMGLGLAGGRGGNEQRRRLRSASGERERERERRGRERVEWSRGPGGLRGNARGVQALGVKQEVAHGGARASGTRPSS